MLKSVSSSPSAVSGQLNASTEYLDIPAGTTAQRPATPNSGMLRFNTDSTSFEGHNGTAWGALGGGGSAGVSSLNGLTGDLTGFATQAGVENLTNKNLTSATNAFPTLNQNTTGTASNVTGTVAVANGGTGSTTAAAARTALSAQETLVSATNIKTINGNTLLGAGDLAISGGGGSSTITISNKTIAYTVVAGDIGTVINCTSGTFIVSLTAAATLGAGFNCWVWNSGSSSGVITIDPNGTELIEGLSTLRLDDGEGVQIICDGTKWRTAANKELRLYAEHAGENTTRPIASGVSTIAMGGVFGGSAVTAAAHQSTAIGINSAGNGSQTVAGAGAMALGGSYASGTDSFAAAIANNTSTYGATGSSSVAIGGNNKVSSAGSYATSIGGWQNTSSANWATCLGGRTCVAGFDYAVALGYSGTPNAIGKMAFGHAAGIGPGIGWGTLSLYKQTIDATATILTSDNAAASTANQVILPNNSAYAFDGTIVARQQAAGGIQSAAWKVEGLIRRGATAATTTLVASTVTAISNVPGWALALSADTTNGGLAVTATGAAATNIRWVATIRSSEVTY